VLALLAALWPNGNYRPIEAQERWTAQDLPMVRAVATRSIAPITQPASVAQAEAEAPVGDGSGMVVEGDSNLAVALNTTDGASVFRLAFAVRSVAGGAVDQTNTAIALASCTACTTVALAFQVLLVFDDVTSITPENRATAVNVACRACVTFASATQIILGFDQPMTLTEEGAQRLAEVHSSLLRLEQTAASLDADALAEAVAEAKEELVAILEEELVPVAPQEETETSDTTVDEESADEEAADSEDTDATGGEAVDGESDGTTTTTSTTSEPSRTTTSTTSGT
jgi:putative peptide zinc metalloprotease protein